MIANNKAWASAQTVRRTWLRALLARKSAPKGTIALLAAALVHDTYEIAKGAQGGHVLARELFGCPELDSPYYGAGTTQIAALLDEATDGRAQIVALGVALAGYENCLHGDSWRSTGQANARYFGFLAAQGYELCDVEKLSGGLDEDAAHQAGSDWSPSRLHRMAAKCPTCSIPGGAIRSFQSLSATVRTHWMNTTRATSTIGVSPNPQASPGCLLERLRRAGAWCDLSGRSCGDPHDGGGDVWPAFYADAGEACRV